MAKLSRATEQALDVIAHVSMAHSLDKDVEGMKGFSAFYRKEMSAKDKDILNHFDRLCRAAYRDLAKSLAQDLKSSDGR